MKKSLYLHQVADTALAINAIKLNPKEPFEWASGYRMPVYNDNRLFLYDITHRNLIIKAFKQVIINSGIRFEVIAGTSTAGIPWATLLAQEFGFHLIYIRDKPKGHGLKNRIEGIDEKSGLGGLETVVVEDLISTGESSARAVQAVRDAGGKCNHIFSIFDYNFNEGREAFQNLNPPCKTVSIWDYQALIEIVQEKKYFSPEEIAGLLDWRGNPFDWGALRGFPRVVKEKV